MLETCRLGGDGADNEPITPAMEAFIQAYKEKPSQIAAIKQEVVDFLKKAINLKKMPNNLKSHPLLGVILKNIASPEAQEGAQVADPAVSAKANNILDIATANEKQAIKKDMLGDIMAFLSVLKDLTVKDLQAEEYLIIVQGHLQKLVKLSTNHKEAAEALFSLKDNGALMAIGKKAYCQALAKVNDEKAVNILIELFLHFDNQEKYIPLSALIKHIQPKALNSLIRYVVDDHEMVEIVCEKIAKKRPENSSEFLISLINASTTPAVIKEAVWVLSGFPSDESVSALSDLLAKEPTEELVETIIISLGIMAGAGCNNALELLHKIANTEECLARQLAVSALKEIAEIGTQSTQAAQVAETVAKNAQQAFNTINTRNGLTEKINDYLLFSPGEPLPDKLEKELCSHPQAGEILGEILKKSFEIGQDTPAIETMFALLVKIATPKAVEVLAKVATMEAPQIPPVLAEMAPLQNDIRRKHKLITSVKPIAYLYLTKILTPEATTELTALVDTYLKEEKNRKPSIKDIASKLAKDAKGLLGINSIHDEDPLFATLEHADKTKGADKVEGDLPSVLLLRKFLDAKNPALRRRACEILATKKSLIAARALLKAAQDQDIGVCQAAYAGLSFLGAVKQLRSLIKEADQTKGTLLIAILSGIGTPPALMALSDFAKSEYRNLIIETCYALGKIGTLAACETLKTYFANHQDKGIAQIATEILKNNCRRK